MQVNINRPTLPYPPNPQLQGDPATRRFGIIFLSTLAILLIGVGVGIGVGNLSHYKYFGPYDQRSMASILGNFTFTNVTSGKNYQVRSETNEVEVNDGF